MDTATQISELKKRLSEEVRKNNSDNHLIASIKEEIEKLEATQIPFTVSARTARLIGQENFANAEGAIIELVKNSYDADATVCVIIIDPIQDNLYIFDNVKIPFNPFPVNRDHPSSLIRVIPFQFYLLKLFLQFSQ